MYRLRVSRSRCWCSDKLFVLTPDDSRIRLGWRLGRSAGKGNLRIRALAHGLREIPGCTQDRFPKLGVLFHEWRHGVEKPEHVVTDQHLAVAVRSGPDAD